MTAADDKRYSETHCSCCVVCRLRSFMLLVLHFMIPTYFPNQTS